MNWPLYQTLLVLAAGASASALVLKRAIAPTSLIGGALWAILALQARNIVLYHQDGTTTTVGSVGWQFVALGLAILSLSAGILWYLGVFPPDDRASDPPGQETTGNFPET